MLPSGPLPDLAVNSDDYNRLLLLAERFSAQDPYVSAYLERELNRAELCHPWDPAGVAMGSRVLFRIEDEYTQRLGRLVYPGRLAPEKGDIAILSALGAALIGMHRNKSIEWLGGGRLRTLTVLDYGW